MTDSQSTKIYIIILHFIEIFIFVNYLVVILQFRHYLASPGG